MRVSSTKVQILTSTKVQILTRAIEFPADLEIRLVLPEGPTSRSIKLMCEHWQLKVVDMSFSGLLPQQSTMDQVWSRMKDDAGVTGGGLQSRDGAKQRHVVYVLDTSVFVALRRMAPSEQVLRSSDVCSRMLLV